MLLMAKLYLLLLGYRSVEMLRGGLRLHDTTKTWRLRQGELGFSPQDFLQWHRLTHLAHLSMAVLSPKNPFHVHEVDIKKNLVGFCFQPFPEL